MKQILMFLSLFALISCGNNDYEILNEDVSMNVCRMDVKLDKVVNITELEQISSEIRERRSQYDKVWISYYLFDFLPETGISPWAMGSFTPEMEVEIYGQDKPSKNGKDVPFPKYASVIEMLKESNDYVGHNLEVITEDPLHIRVSTDFVKGELEKTIEAQSKRDIIYVSFQAFAETDIDEITVTSIPIQRENFSPKVPYDGKKITSLKETKKVSRTQAQMILEKYLNTKSFKDLYQLHETMYLPSNKFDLLQHGQLENVYSDL